MFFISLILHFTIDIPVIYGSLSPEGVQEQINFQGPSSGFGYPP